jgi:hypothetical protein
MEGRRAPGDTIEELWLVTKVTPPMPLICGGAVPDGNRPSHPRRSTPLLLPKFPPTTPRHHDTTTPRQGTIPRQPKEYPASFPILLPPPLRPSSPSCILPGLDLVPFARVCCQTDCNFSGDSKQASSCSLRSVGFATTTRRPSNLPRPAQAEREPVLYRPHYLSSSHSRSLRPLRISFVRSIASQTHTRYPDPAPYPATPALFQS